MTTAIERHQGGTLTPREERWIDATISQLTSSRSSLVPAALRGKPDDLRLVLTKAAENGVRQYTTALENFHAVDGRIITSAAISVAFARRAGHDVWCEEFSPERCVVAGHRRGKPERVTRVTYTIEMARAANLLNKSNWKSYPAQMLYARASKTWVTMNCPEVLMGLDDGTYFLEDLVDGPPVDGDALRIDVAIAVPQDDDDVEDAELVDADDPAAAMTEDAWAHQWGSLCRTKGATPADSKSILRNVAGVEFAAQVLPEKRTACENALADWAEAMAAPFEEA